MDTDNPCGQAQNSKNRWGGGSIFGCYPQVWIVFGCVALNVILSEFRFYFMGGMIPLFLDMVATALAAFLLGPWYAVVVGVLSFTTASALHNELFEPRFAFILVQIVGALIWGYGYQWVRQSKLHKGARFCYLTILVGVVCSLVAFTIIEIALEGYLATSSGMLFARFLESSGDRNLAIRFQVNLMMSLIDKTIASAAALFIALEIGRRYTLTRK